MKNTNKNSRQKCREKRGEEEQNNSMNWQPANEYVKEVANKDGNIQDFVQSTSKRKLNFSPSAAKVYLQTTMLCDIFLMQKFRKPRHNPPAQFNSNHQKLLISRHLRTSNLEWFECR